jgi:hypothetical protein
MARTSAIACGYKDAIDHDRLRHDPLMKVAVGRSPQTGAPLASQPTISRLENAPSKTEAARLSAALLDQFGTTVKPGRMEILDIDDTFCAAHGGQQLAFWNAHHDERGFASTEVRFVGFRNVRVLVVVIFVRIFGTESEYSQIAETWGMEFSSRTSSTPAAESLTPDGGSHRIGLYSEGS